MATPPSYGELIRRHRKAAGLTQAELGERLDFESPQPRVSELERDRREVPPVPTLHRIEEVLGLWRGQLLLEAGDVVPPRDARQAIEADPDLEGAEGSHWRAHALTAYDSARAGALEQRGADAEPKRRRRAS